MLSRVGWPIVFDFVVAMLLCLVPALAAPQEPPLEDQPPAARKRQSPRMGPSGGPMREPSVPPQPAAEPDSDTEAPTEPEKIESPKQPPALLKGDLFWSGRLVKNEVIEINGMSASLGDLSGKALPGKRVGVRAFSPNVEIVRQPTE